MSTKIFSPDINGNTIEKEYSKVQKRSSTDENFKNRCDSDFQIRSSYLSDVLKSNKTKVVFYDAFNLICVAATVSQLFDYWIDTNRFHVFWTAVFSTFSGFWPYFLTAYLFFNSWSLLQWKLVKSTRNPLIFTIIQIPMILFLFAVPSYIVTFNPVGVTLRIIVGCETVRFGLKLWALVGETFGKDEDQQATLREFFYFLYAPTLIFRKSYPKKARSWSRLFLYIFLVYIQIGLVAELFAGWTIRMGTIAGLSKYSSHLNSSALPIPILGPALIFMFWLFHFHTWLNMCSEILCFGDQRFYGPWWEPMLLVKMIKEWNPIIHNFIKKYAYDSISKKTSNSIYRFLAVGFISGPLHDFIFSLVIKRVCYICSITYISALICMAPFIKSSLWPLGPIMQLVFPTGYLIYLSYCCANQ
ncbi:sterol O-acyltransferase 1-like [Brevipalpus obovatus]|uniref:sterol O-acyltransferase 1-like n=1 Tax=Brevipalpus obovatus TaxID=246614 RepID=UPI003D9F0E69